MAYLGAGLDAVNETLSTINMVCDTMTGDGSTTTKVLSSPKSPGSVNNVSIYYDGVAQKPTTDYTLSNLTITFTTAPENNVNVVILSYANEFANILSDKTVYSSSIEDGAITNDLISGISSSKLTGALPALDGSALTGITPLDPVLLNEAGNPTVSSMTATGNGVGTLWVNSTTGNMFVCTDATVGANVWINIGEASGGVLATYMSATGGSITEDGDYKVHTFTSSGTFTPTTGSITDGDKVDYLVLAGGGGGGNDYYGGGGGAGGYLTATSFSVTSSAMTVTVGGGGQVNVNGQNSVFGSITSTGGGAGGTGAYGGLNAAANGKNGGSGGGGNANSNVGGSGIAGQGFAGGTASAGGAAGSGGGAGGVAANNVGQNVSQVGGVGLSSSITGTAVVRGEGGTGGAHGVGGSNSGIPVAGGGRGSYHSPSDTVATAGAVNRGGGGGGSGWPTSPAQTQGIGGSGVVIVRYKFR